MPNSGRQRAETNNGVVFLRVAINPDFRAVLFDGVQKFRAVDPLRCRLSSRFITATQTSQKRLVCGSEFIGKKKTAGGIRLRI